MLWFTACGHKPASRSSVVFLWLTALVQKSGQVRLRWAAMPGRLLHRSCAIAPWATETGSAVRRFRRSRQHVSVGKSGNLGEHAMHSCSVLERGLHIVQHRQCLSRCHRVVQYTCIIRRWSRCVMACQWYDTVPCNRTETP